MGSGIGLDYRHCMLGNHLHAPPILEGQDRINWKSKDGSFNTSTTYDLFHPPGPKVGWSSRLMGSFKIPKNCFILWLAIMGRLSTLDRPWLHHIEGSCILCQDGVPETHDHLFFSCSFSHRCFATIRQQIPLPWPHRDWQHGVQWASSRWRGKHVVNEAFRSLLASIVYHIREATQCKVFIDCGKSLGLSRGFPKIPFVTSVADRIGSAVQILVRSSRWCGRIVANQYPNDMFQFEVLSSIMGKFPIRWSLGWRKLLWLKHFLTEFKMVMDLFSWHDIAWLVLSDPAISEYLARDDNPDSHKRFCGACGGIGVGVYRSGAMHFFRDAVPGVYTRLEGRSSLERAWRVEFYMGLERWKGDRCSRLTSLLSRIVSYLAEISQSFQQQ
ncbi:hypothetical protein Sango_3035500 [Sesamum angolense]|uniref:Reverse transcriptase zinc-binding domain-containing protein n=1 Tax=Sesamum angolense TaxID=2727404 RepID=A0AAE1TB53_9LAMI|nr:hypothetical protein Sango_3035500 [Sesamum angolense]